ncbi:hypothetical protein TRP8649_03863 [Pelagimonas phthalicica]|uniref:Rhamnosyl transferase n=1 Tax=Pelagimonas phthalicica TaxID=1037362 RepID=A0A238JHP2_9RHOB|nr:putative rhamnosyl transferase [Pelagimonas phthalicica]TDS89101.1 putative rhamnosyltransferase [Pelagimonas phthalicica]SMX29724.1 hypothetical protein TRP8649_03863 [Pelagimonas phthalicica]
MQVIGFCRFSYPAEGGFQVEHDSVEARKAFLYAPERINERFRYFETICLPGLRAQTDPDFTFVILIGDDLPEEHVARLFDLVEDLPQAVIVARPPMPHRAVCKEVINLARHDMDADCLQFRLDDDDTVARDFVERIRADARLIAPLRAKHRLVAMDYNRGFLMRPGADGIAAEACLIPYHSMGLALVVRGGCHQSIMNFAHNKLNQHMPTVTFTDKPMYVRGHSDNNDSRQKKHVKPVILPMLDSAGEAELKAEFGIDGDHIRRVFNG